MTGPSFRRNRPGFTGSAFILGVVAGVFLREAVRYTRDLVRRGRSHRDDDGVVTYGENLPESLERREPAPHPGQPRYGGTGALGVSPAAAIGYPPRG